MILGLWEIILVFLISAIGSGLAILVYTKNPKERANQFFTFLVFSFLIWILSAFFSEIPKNLQYSLFLSRIAYTGVLLSAVFLFYFSFYFPRRKILKKEVNYLIIGTSVIFTLANLGSDLIIKDAIPVSWGFNLLFGKLYFPYLIFCIFAVFYAFSNFLSDFKKATKLERLQLGYLLLGLSIFTITSIIVNVIIRSIVGSDIYYRIGNYSGIFLVVLSGIAILKYHLFGIHVILTELLVGVMGLILFLQMIFAPTKEWRTSTIPTFILFLIFGYLLIKYTHQEIERREKLEKLTKELQKKTTELEEAYKRIEALSEMKSEFLKVVNHQLRTPFSIIRGLVSMMSENGVSPERQKEFIQKLNLSVERLGIILDDILAAQALVGGVEPPILLPCEIEKVVEMQINRFKLQAQTKGIEILYKKPKEPLPITLADQQMIERVISRLIDNAILYTEKGEVEVSLDLEKENNKEWIKISIKDQGIGLDEKDKENLFKLFYRGEKATLMHNNGTGLALFIVKNYVKAHGGKIEAKSEGRGKGSTFIVALPVITEL